MIRLLALCLLAAPALRAEGVVFAIRWTWTEAGTPRTGWLVTSAWGPWAEAPGTPDASWRAALGDTLFLYPTLGDRSALARHAAFPLPAFEPPAAPPELAVAAPDLRPLRVLRRGATPVTLLTPLAPADTAWVGLRPKAFHPEGEEAGCRLVLYALGERIPETRAMTAFATRLRLGADPATDPVLAGWLARWREERIVVLDRCGC